MCSRHMEDNSLTPTRSIAYFEGLPPAWFGPRPIRIKCHGVQPVPEEQEDTVHDPHDEVRGLPQLAHSGYVGGLDGLQSCLCLFQCRPCLLQLPLGHCLVCLTLGGGGGEGGGGAMLKRMEELCRIRYWMYSL